MSKQPVPQNIKNNYSVEDKYTYTLLVDGNNLLKISLNGDPKVNTKGEHIGGVFQFLLQLKIMLAKRDFDYIYVFWDGDNSGELRARILPEYKANRENKHFDLDRTYSEYDKNIDNYVKFILNKKKNKTKKPPEKQTNDTDENFQRERTILQSYLEELFVRQVMCDRIESDDLIAYYCNNKKSNDRVYIMSGDRDITQLIDKDVAIYAPDLKIFLTVDNHVSKFGITHDNVLIKKVICGDVSDNIKGIKGVGMKNLLTLVPEIDSKKLNLNDVIDRAKKLNEERTLNKKKPLVFCENIINQVSDGSNNGNVFEINEKIINLKKPLLTEESLDLIKDMMYSPIDSEDRNMSNLYKLIIKDDITDLINENKFSSFFAVFNKTIEKEKKYLENY